MNRTQSADLLKLRNIIRLAVLCMGMLVASSSALGQVATGLPPFSSMAPSTFDSVNQANLNVFFQIPIVYKAGKGGHPFSFALGYNSAVWTPVGTSGSKVWVPAASWGWGSVTPDNEGELVETWNQGSCTDYLFTTYYWDQWTLTAYIDKYGTSHPIGTTSAGLTVSDYGSSGADCYGDSYPNTIDTTTTDGSGYTITTQSFTDSGGNGTGGGAWVYSPSGDELEFSGPPPYTSGSILYANADGEGWTSSGSTISYGDTLGATALTATAYSNYITYTYTGPSGSTYSYTAYYTSKSVKTNFGCSGISEFGPSSQYLLTEIDLPDISTNSNDKYTFTYEVTPGYSSNVTGRLASVTLPTGGTISYSYSGGSNGITCADGSTATLARATPDGTWTYAHSENTNTTWTTTITDPTSSSNQTVLNFVVPSNGNPLETKRQLYSGSSGGGTLMKTIDTCYNGSSLPCATTSVSLPISNKKAEVTMPSLSASETYTTYNS